MSKRITGLAKRRRKHPHKTKKRLEIKRLMLEEKKKKRRR